MSRVVDVSQACVHITTQDGCLLVSDEGRVVATVPIGEVDCLVLGSPRATLSVAALAALADAGCASVICGRSSMPAGMVLPFRPQHQVGARYTAQAGASKPLRDRIWKQLVQSKVRGQAAVLFDETGHSRGLEIAARKVRSGDSDNVEARAARRYWRALFGRGFRRRRGEGQCNQMLDYGYAILRAASARSLCAAGLHPGLGVHHKHRSNSFPLADDAMEPFRPVVDRVVRRAQRDHPDAVGLNPELKKALAACLDERIPVDGQERRLTDVMARCASSISGVFLGERKKLILPWGG